MDDKVKNYFGIVERHYPGPASEIAADIVAVHGLGGDPYWSWVGTKRCGDKEPVTKVDWLTELLPACLSKCRVLSFGYHSHYIKNAPKRDIANCAEELLHALSNNRERSNANKRPILFLCHSLGGLVVKEALVKATLASRRFGNIRACAHGIVFLGTPHYGASSAKYGEILAGIAKALGRGSDKRLVSSLRMNSPELLKLAKNFSDIYDDIDVFCFYELLPSEFSTVVVTESSATILGRPSDGLNANHKDLNKFAEACDPNFVKVVNELQNMLKSLLASKANEARGPRPWELTAILIEQLDQNLDLSIQSVQKNRFGFRAHQTLLSLRYRFRSWAFSIGLLALSNTRQSMYDALDTPITEHLNEQLRKLIALVDPATLTIMVSRNLSLPREVQMNFTQMFHLLPDNLGVPSSYTTASLILDSSYDLKSWATATTDIDKNVNKFIVLKRISLLMEQSAARRQSSDRLIIDPEYLSFDPSSPSLSNNFSTGVFKGRSPTTTGIDAVRGKRDHVAMPHRQALIEWKHYDDIWGTDAGNILFERIELLTDFLRMATTSSSPSDDINFRLLECFGYCHDAANQRFGLVFGVPKEIPDRQSVLSLRDLTQNYCRGGLLPPSVGSRIDLARMLCEALFGLHVSGWFHKSFTSRAVVFFSEGNSDASPRSMSCEEDDEHGLESQPMDYSMLAPESESDTSSRSMSCQDGDAGGSIPQVEDYSIQAPFVLGFEHSRPGATNQFSEINTTTAFKEPYKHPAYNSEYPLQKYRHEFDYYSLGVVLIEIGNWTPVDVLLEECPLPDNSADPLPISDRARALARHIELNFARNLNSVVGDVYQETVLELLGLFGEGYLGSSQEKNEFLSIAELVSFQSRVLEALGSRRV